MSEITSKDGTSLVQENYITYARYVCATRAYPGVVDGCKSIHKRILYSVDKSCGKYMVKSPELIAATVVYHPHPTSIYPVIVSMASPYDCAFPLFDIEGNFGGNGFPPAAERYTSAGLSSLARDIFLQFTEYTDMVEGEMDKPEPKHLAALLPLCFLHGTYGIAVGMGTVSIPPLSPNDMIKYYIEVIKSGDLNKIPDVLVRPNIGNVKVVSTPKEWDNVMVKGSGSLRVSPNMTREPKENRIIINGLPNGKSFEHVRAILEPELSKDQINLRDETTTSTRYVLEVLPYKKVDMEELYTRLNKKLTCVNSYKFIFADEGISVYCGFHNIVKRSLEYTAECCQRKLKYEIGNISFKLGVLEIIELMKTDGSLQKLVKFNNAEAISFIVEKYKASEEQAKSVLAKPISYLTKEHQPEMEAMRRELELAQSRSNDVFAYLLEVYQSLQIKVKEFTKGKDLTVFVEEEKKRKVRQDRREKRKVRKGKNAAQ